MRSSITPVVLSPLAAAAAPGRVSLATFNGGWGRQWGQLQRVFGRRRGLVFGAKDPTGHRAAQAAHLCNLACREQRRIRFDPLREEIVS